jgi:spermidine/putrescine transport system substrate-binding protein
MMKGNMAMTATNNDPDPRTIARLATGPTTRRRFLGGGAAAAAALTLGPAVLAGCGSKDSTTDTATAPADDGSPASGELRISNWPLYMTEGFVADFQKASGLTVDYKEDFNDNEEWFAKHKEALSRRQDIGADLVVPSDFMMARLKNLGWLNEIGDTRWTNKKNLREALLNSQSDPGRKVSAPYMSYMVGLAYNRAATGRDITKIDDLWDPAFMGKVSLLSDLQDGLGLIMRAQGNSISEPTTESVQKAADLVREQKEKGQIRRFTGNDYADDLAAGNIIVAQAYSGDVIQLQADNPDLRFVIPESGGLIGADAMVIPYTTENQKAAETWINYLYERPNYAKLVVHTQFVPVLTDMTDELAKIDPRIASNQLVNPSPETLAKLTDWAVLTDKQTQEFNTIYAAITGS